MSASKLGGMSISIHALLAESDVEEVSGDTWARDFYPRSPCGERPWAVFLGCDYPFISIHALLAESDSWTENEGPSFCISIHALLAESDPTANTGATKHAPISIHALLAESD